MRTTILKVIGAALLVSSTVQMAAAAEHHARRHHATAVEQEQFRNSNAYYAAPDHFSARSRVEAEDEAAMTSGIAGH
jgi:hypothetical protein